MLKCDKCTRTFETQGALNGHQRSHSFFAFLGKQIPKEFRERQREESQIKIVMAAIKHRGLYKDETHCDICAVVNEVIDQPLLRDMAEYFESEARV